MSPTVIKQTARLFRDDPTKSFIRYDPSSFVDNSCALSGDLALSLDVLFHFVQKDMYHQYLCHLFDAARKYVAIYAIDEELPRLAAHVKTRKFSQWVNTYAQEFELIQHIPPAFKNQGISDSEFSSYRRLSKWRNAYRVAVVH
mmetsp:Transcript_39926/g.99901  ORF Transcript_39926/g.99901 Transcript_39926/m.99901 type:complete len:143 (-) Transcript_39926:164-592(-)